MLLNSSYHLIQAKIKSKRKAPLPDKTHHTKTTSQTPPTHKHKTHTHVSQDFTNIIDYTSLYTSTNTHTNLGKHLLTTLIH